MSDAVLQPFLEKLAGRIAVSDAARKMIVEHLDVDAVVIPNGVAVGHFADAPPLPGYPRPGGTVGFVGRYDEPRKGMDVLIAALDLLAPDRPGLRLVLAGRGDAEQFRGPPAAHARRPRRRARTGQRGRQGPPAAQHRRLLRAQHRPGELRDHPARGDGRRARPWWPATWRRSGRCCPRPRAWPGCCSRPVRRGRWPTNSNASSTTRTRAREFRARSARAVLPYDWAVVARQVVRVYELALGGTGVLAARPDECRPRRARPSRVRWRGWPSACATAIRIPGPCCHSAG